MIAADWTDQPGNVFTSDRAERALLGSLLLVGETGLARCERLRSDDFRSPHRAAVFVAMRKLAFYGAPIDALTVVDELEKGKLAPPEPGWGTAVASLLDHGTVGAADGESIGVYGQIIVDAAALRRRSAWGA